MKKYFHALFACCFFLACCLPAAGMAVLGPSGPGSNEILTGPPQPVTPEGQPNLRFLSDAAEYFSDHFAFRQELITADARLKAQVFATSAQPDVALGQEGWLFYGETIDDYTGADTMSPRQVYCVASALRQNPAGPGHRRRPGSGLPKRVRGKLYRPVPAHWGL